jgi:hypothetical protein
VFCQYPTVTQAGSRLHFFNNLNFKKVFEIALALLDCQTFEDLALILFQEVLEDFW